MLIGLISDTHILFSDRRLPHQIKDVFRGVDLILHAGDIWVPSALDELETIAPVRAAWGDDDLEADLGSDPRMIKEPILHLDGITLWLTHIKPRYGLVNLKGELSYSKQNPEDPEESPDVVIFGHTHSAAIEQYKGVLLVNPGSITLPNYILKVGTVGLLTIDSGKVAARIVQLE